MPPILERAARPATRHLLVRAVLLYNCSVLAGWVENQFPRRRRVCRVRVRVLPFRVRVLIRVCPRFLLPLSQHDPETYWAADCSVGWVGEGDRGDLLLLPRRSIGRGSCVVPMDDVAFELGRGLS